MKTDVRILLSAMMFLQFFVWGAWYVTAPNYLGTIGFVAEDIGWTYSVGPIAGIISPFFIGMVADRFFPAQRVLAVMHIAGGLIMFAAISLMESPSPSPKIINLVFFGYMLTYFPTLALSNTIAMKNMSNPGREFPMVRVFGTIGWIVAGLTISAMAWDTSIKMFYLTAVIAVALGLFSFLLPHTPPVKDGKISVRQILGLDALLLLRDRSYLVFVISSFLMCIPLAFYYQITSRVVEMGDLPIALTMASGQMSEIFFMAVMPFFFARLGVKWMLGVGMLAWVVRYALFAIGAPSQVAWMILMGVLLHGICYDFFFVTGQIYTNQMAPKELRGQAQGMLVLFTLGLGMFFGAQIAGKIEASHTTAEAKSFAAKVALAKDEADSLREQLDTNGEDKTLLEQIAAKTAEAKEARRSELKAIEWRPLWAKPAIFAGIVTILFIFLFRQVPVKKERVGRQMNE